MRFLSVLLAAAALATAASAAPPPPLEAYGRLPAVESARLSPSGDRFAIIATEKGAHIVYVRQSTDGKLVAAVNFGPNKLRRLTWAGEDHLLIFNTASGKLSEPGAKTHEWEGLINLDLRTGKPAMLLAKSTTYVDAIFGYYGSAQVGGRWYAFVGAVPFAHTQEWSRSEIYADLDRIDLETGKVETVVSSSERDRGWLVGPDGAVLAHTIYDPTSRTSSLYAGVGEGGKPLAQASGSGKEIRLEGRGRTPGALVVRDEADGREELREIAADGTGQVILKDANASGTLDDRDSGLAIGFSGENKDSLFDPALEARLKAGLAPFTGEETTLVSYSRGFERLIVQTEGQKDPGRYYLVDTVQRSAVPVGDVRPEIPADQVGLTKMIDYKSADGIAMDGVLTLPPGRDPKTLPLVVMPHGGPIVPGDKVGFDWWAQAFASRGYAVFQPNYRGTLGYGVAFRQAAEGEFGRKMQSDISDGVAALAKAGTIDPKRVCIVGGSYGGYAALAGVTLQQGLYRCAVSVAGIGDMRKMMLDENIASGRDRRALDFWHGLAGAKSQDLDAISPVRFAARADAPVLLIHGENDTVVPIDQSRLMEKALRSAGKPVELVVMPSEDHWLSYEATRQTMLQHAVAFVEKHNPAS